MRQQLEDQKNELEELKERLRKTYNNMIASRRLHEERAGYYRYRAT